MKTLNLIWVSLLLNSSLLAQDVAVSKIDIEKFLNLSVEAKNHRAQRLVRLDEFVEMSNDPQTIILSLIHISEPTRPY